MHVADGANGRGDRYSLHNAHVGVRQLGVVKDYMPRYGATYAETNGNRDVHFRRTHVAQVIERER